MSTTTSHPLRGRRPGAAFQRRGLWLGFLVVLAASVMDLLDSTIAQTAAPAIRRDLGGSYAALEWISAAYTLAMAVTLLLGSRLGDLFGRRRVLLVGIGGFVGRVGAVRARPVAGRADRRARAPGRRGRDHGAAGLRPDPRAVRRRGSAEGVRRVRPGDGPGRGRRAARRRRARQPQPARHRLAGDLPRQRADRPARDRGRPAVPAPVRAGRPGRAARRAERRARDGRRLRARVPADRGPRARLAGVVVRAARRRRRRARRVRLAPGSPLAPGPRAAGRAVDPAPARRTSRGWPSCSASSARWAG